MAVTLSPRLGLNRWSAGSDPFNRVQLDADHQKLDDLVAIDLQGTMASRPAFGIRGRYYFATDNGVLYRDTGTAWVGVNDLSSAVSAATLTTKGDLLVRNNAGPTRQGVGANRTMLLADSVQGNGVRWGKNPELAAYSEVSQTANASGATTIDCALGNLWKLTLTGNVTSLTLTNVPVGGFSLYLHLVQDATGGRAFAWPGPWNWAGGIEPQLVTTANAVNIVTVQTLDGGVRWDAFFSSRDSK